jgi:hypothetical protein
VPSVVLVLMLPLGLGPAEGLDSVVVPLELSAKLLMLVDDFVLAAFFYNQV